MASAVHLDSERTIGEDWVVRYDNQFFQLQAQSRYYGPARGLLTQTR